MSKKNNAAEATVEATVTTTKSYPTPIDGSGAKAYIETCGGVSKAIRKLTDEGFGRGEVAKMLGKRYQHVRNVLITPIKKPATA